MYFVLDRRDRESRICAILISKKKCSFHHRLHCRILDINETMAPRIGKNRDKLINTIASNFSRLVLSPRGWQNRSNKDSAGKISGLSINTRELGLTTESFPYQEPGVPSRRWQCTTMISPKRNKLRLNSG